MAAETTTERSNVADEPFPLGAHIVTARRWYTHHGIYIGAGQVVHNPGLASALRRGRVATAILAEFARGRPVSLRDEVDATYCGVEVVARACSRLGEDAYDLLRNNCEHFCSWCLSGAARSPQVERLLSMPGAMTFVMQLLGILLNAWMNARDALPAFRA